jgi:ATP-binding cassette subfamily B protein
MNINNYKTDEVLQSSIKKNVIFRLVKYFKPHKKTLIKIFVLLLIVLIVETINPYLIKIAVDVYIKNKNIVGICMIGIIMAIFNLNIRRRKKKVGDVEYDYT